MRPAVPTRGGRGTTRAAAVLFESRSAGPCAILARAAATAAGRGGKRHLKDGVRGNCDGFFYRSVRHHASRFGDDEKHVRKFLPWPPR